jgi:uncharacterized repeat protein (TIGR01451 family)
MIGAVLPLAPRLLAGAFSFVYPPDANVQFDRAIIPPDPHELGEGDQITITITVANQATADLRGFYFSDQVPNGWGTETMSVSIDGLPITGYVFEQGTANEIYDGFTPHRWMFEIPTGGGGFTPTHPIPNLGGMGEIVYRLTITGGSGGDYSILQSGWAGWLGTEPSGTAVFGYQMVTGTLEVDFEATPRLGLAPLEVVFSDLSKGDVMTYTWDFGDGEGSAVANPVHVYEIPGRYTVSLTVENAEDSDTLVRPDYIYVTETLYRLYFPVAMVSR